LNNFDVEDQKNFLVKYWHNLNEKHQARPTSANKLKQLAEDLVARIKSNRTSQSLNELIGIPLQTKMLDDIYFEKIKDDKDFSNLILVNLTDLYTQFIESKIRIQYEEKLKIEIDRDQDRFEEQKDKFYAQHIKLSSSILFESKNQKEDNERDQKRIVKYGVIVAFTNGIPTFLHQSFAEFFLAKSCLQKIKEQKRTKDDDKELEQILQYKRHFHIRRFLNDLMEIDVNQQQQQEENKNKNNIFDKEIENCRSEHLLSLLKYFLEGVNLYTKNRLLIKASKEGNKEIVSLLLLEQGIDVNQKDVNERSALINATIYGHTDIVQMLLQVENINVNKQDESGWTALMKASEYGHKDIVKMLLQHKDIDVNRQNWKGTTALLWANLNGHREIVQMLEEKNMKQKQQNIYGRTALFVAIEKGHKDTVQILVQNENLDVNLRDEDGWTALMWACREGHKEIVQMLLQHKHINVNQCLTFFSSMRRLCRIWDLLNLLIVQQICRLAYLSNILT
jgi:ankyrin repeat protein